MVGIPARAGGMPLAAAWVAGRRFVRARLLGRHGQLCPEALITYHRVRS